jgi:hypothetical protein
VVVFEETEDAQGLRLLATCRNRTGVYRVGTYLGIACVLRGIMKCGRGEMMLLPRSRNAFGESGCRGRAGVVMSVGEVCGLHGGDFGARGTCW